MKCLLYKHEVLSLVPDPLREDYCGGSHCNLRARAVETGGFPRLAGLASFAVSGQQETCLKKKMRQTVLRNSH